MTAPMKSTEIIRMACHNLGQRKLRTGLNLTGIVVGCVVLLLTAAGGAGVRDALHALFDASELSRQIHVWPDVWGGIDPPESEIRITGDISEERRERLRNAKIQQWKSQNPARSDYAITPQELSAFAAIPHVDRVVPYIAEAGTLTFQSFRDDVHVGVADIHSREAAQYLIAGNMPAEDDLDGVVIHEFLAYRMGFRDDADISRVPGQQIVFEKQLGQSRLGRIYDILSRHSSGRNATDSEQQQLFMQTFMQLIGDLDATSLSEEQKSSIRKLVHEATTSEIAATGLRTTRQFTIRGVYRSGDESLSGLFQKVLYQFRLEVLAHPETARSLRFENPDQRYVHNAVVTVDSTKHLQEVTDRIRQMKCNADSPIRLLENVDRSIDRNMWIVYGIAAAILLTAAVGISNTLIISVMERTPEFGILKALGGRDSHLVKLMMYEGAILGATGAGIALLVSYVVASCGHFLLESYVESRINSDLTASLFRFSALPVLTVFCISVVICTMASILPAWRAARLDPVVAMQRT